MHKSNKKIMIGKVYWKSVVLPAVLTGTTVLCWTRLELKVLQKIENGVKQMVVGGLWYATVSTLQGEVGAPGMVGLVARDIRHCDKLGYRSI